MHLLTAFLVAAATSRALAASGPDLSLLRIRIPSRVKLTNARPRVNARAAIRIANRGSVPIVVADPATLAATIHLRVADLEGPIACAPVGITAVVAGLRFPLTLR